MQAESAHYSKENGSSQIDNEQIERTLSGKRGLEPGTSGDGNVMEDDLDAKRRRILEATRGIDADSEGSGSDGSDEERLVS